MDEYFGVIKYDRFSHAGDSLGHKEGGGKDNIECHISKNAGVDHIYSDLSLDEYWAI